MIIGRVKGQDLTIDQDIIAANTIDYLEVQFYFDEKWDGFEKTAFFKHKEEDPIYAILLDENDMVNKDDHLNLLQGTWEVWVYGLNPEGSRVTTDIAKIKVKETGMGEGQQIPEMPLSYGEQVYLEAKKATETAQRAEQKVDEALDFMENIEIDEFDVLENRTANLEAASEDVLYTAQSDDSFAEAKAVPENVLPYAKIKAIGGASVEKGGGVLHPNPILNIVSGDHAFAVPDEIAALPNWGHGVGKYINYADIEKRQYVQNCVVAELSEVFDHATYTYVHPLTFDIPVAEYETYVNAIETIICSHPEISFYFSVVTELDDGALSGGLIPLINGEMPTPEIFQAFIDEQRAAGTPITVVYGWPEPTVTDISDIAQDIYIPVTAGGEVIFENNASDPLYSSIEFYVRKDIAENCAKKSYVDNVFSGAVKGTLLGTAVAASDVSPVEHDLKIKVSSKNLLDLSGFQGEYINGDAKIIYNGGESFTVSGSADTYMQWQNNITSPIVRGKKYVFSASGDAIGIRVGIKFMDSGNQTVTNGLKYLDTPLPKSVVIDTDSIGEYQKIAFYITKLTNVAEMSGTVFIQLEEGTAATEYVPYVDATGATVSRCGKNLIDFTRAEGRNSDQTVMVNESDNSITWSGDYYFKVPVSLPAGVTVTFSCESEKYKYFTFIYEDGTYDQATSNPRTSKKSVSAIAVYKTSPATAEENMVFRNLQLEVGDSATEYEPYIEPVTAVADGEGNVTGLVSLAPNMSLTSDMDGVVIECEYNRDLMKVIETLTQAIISLGGNI